MFHIFKCKKDSKKKAATVFCYKRAYCRCVVVKPAARQLTDTCPRHRVTKVTEG